MLVVWNFLHGKEEFVPPLSSEKTMQRESDGEIKATQDGETKATQDSKRQEIKDEYG